MLLYVILGVIALLAYLYMKNIYSYYKEKGVKYVKPLPIVGCIRHSVFSTKTFVYMVDDWYNKFKNERYFGIYQFLSPTLVIKDPDLLKDIGVSSFSHFQNHQSFSSEDDHLWSNNLFARKGDDWKDMRSTLTPSFTGIKMRAMLSLINDCAKQMVAHYKDKNEDVVTFETKDMFSRFTNDVIATCAFGITCNSFKEPDNEFYKKGDDWKDMRSTLTPSFTGIKMRAMLSLINDCAKQMVAHYKDKNEDVVTFETKDLFSRFTNDVIATCAFGITCNSFKEPDNEFYKKGSNAMDFSGFKGLKFLLNTLSPTLVKLLRIRIVSNETEDFFHNIITETIKVRKEQGLKRPDMVHLLMEAQKQREKEDATKKPITVKDITAQAFVFFAAGFDTTSTLMMYIAYELAVNKDCQDKLIKEIDEVRAEGELTYEKLMQMKYLDMICSETLRLWPPTLLTDRTCTIDYVIEPVNPGEKRFLVKKDSLVWVPIYSIHRDPENFENPNKFNPERFSDENKDNIKPGTYMPFGMGPRLCIGNRFALMETKAMIFHLLSNFEFVPVQKSVIPVVLSKSHFNLEAENGMWLGLKKRNH